MHACTYFGTCTMQAACGMAATEAATVVTLYVLLDPSALVLRARGLRYRFRSSLEDVVALSLARCVAVLLAYGFGAGRKYQRCAARLLCLSPVLLRPQLAAACYFQGDWQRNVPPKPSAALPAAEIGGTTTYPPCHCIGCLLADVKGLLLRTAGHTCTRRSHLPQSACPSWRPSWRCWSGSACGRRRPRCCSPRPQRSRWCTCSPRAAWCSGRAGATRWACSALGAQPS